ncbi:Crp/Fnr family transcriptional regulator [uncultured Sphingomonas sp.]|uniref:Crp/Fnr family transcriptional regulator n=1 Tax=uncultured Sphingomonas sp. TaxID=158754 RepID=UPI0035CB578F
MRTERFLMGRGRSDLTAEERAMLEDAVGGVQTLPARYLMVRAGKPVSHSTLLLDGYICRYMDDREGHRQLVAVHVPGDFVDLHAFPMRWLDHDVATLGPVTIATFEHTTLEKIIEQAPHLTRMLWFSTLLDAAMHREWIFRLGRLDSTGRLAHFFCEIHERLAMVGLAKDGIFTLPMIQADLAEACGMTPVHVNRTLRVLREARLLHFRNGVATIPDAKGLASVAEFDPGYLYGSAGQLTGG